MPQRRLVMPAATLVYWAVYLVAVLEALHYRERPEALVPLATVGLAVGLGLALVTAVAARRWPVRRQASPPTGAKLDVATLRAVADELSGLADAESERTRQGDPPGLGNPRLDGHARGFAAGYAVSVLSHEATRLRQRALEMEERSESRG